MNVAELLTPDRIAIPVRARTVQEAAYVLLERLGASGTLDPDASLQGLAGEVLGRDARRWRGGDRLLVVALGTSAVEEVTAGLAVAHGPLEIPGEEHVGALLLLLAPELASDRAVQAAPVIVGFFEKEDRLERLLACETTAEVRAFRSFMELELGGRLKVEDALAPLTYRVYPDTPLDEVVDLIARKNLQAVPVVGDKYEVLGMITAGQALRYALPRHRGRDEEGGKSGAGKEDLLARDVMSRSVMCVAEDENLLDAAALMVNKDVSQLPVVREGEIIGMLTRDRVLRALSP